jgi:AcrR family transcriptional regulator
MSRKKEPKLIDINQKRIAEVAKELFHKYGIENTKIDDIAREANMSKSTLYVYFRSKEDIGNYISLEAMTYLYENINQIISSSKEDPYLVFMSICNFLCSFKEKFPISFQLIIEEICIDETIMLQKPFLKEIYEVGEQINQLFYEYFKKVLDNENEIELKSLIFTLWGSIYGIIELADNKKQYIQKSMNKSKEQFLQQSFSGLYKLLIIRR